MNKKLKKLMAKQAELIVKLGDSSHLVRKIPIDKKYKSPNIQIPIIVKK